MRRSGSALALVLVLATAVAHAASASGVAPSEATPVQREEAQTHFARGHDLYTAKKFDDAAGEFEKSYAIVASPNALFFLARCERERGKLVTAYAELGRTAAEAREHASEDPRYAKTADAATEERNAIAPQLGFVTVTVTGGAADTSVLLAGERFPRAALGDAIPVMPGSTTVVVETPGKPPVHQTISVFAGEHKAVSLDAGPVGSAPSPPPSAEIAPPPPPPHVQTPEEEAASRARVRLWSYGSAGVAGAGLITFAVAGVLSNNTYSDLQSKCHGPCQPGSGNDGEISSGKTQQTVADVGLVVGLIGATAAVTLFVMSLPSKSDPVSAIVVGPTWMGVRGEF